MLDMRNGMLTRQLVWSTPSGKHLHVQSARLVSLEHRHVLAVSYEVSVDHPAPVVLCSRVINRANAGRVDSASPVDDPRIARRLGRRVLEPRVVEQVGERLVLGYQTVDSGMMLGVAVDHVLDVPSSHQVSVHPEADTSEFIVAVDAEPDVPVRLTKFAAYHSSRSVDAADLVERCQRTLDRVTFSGFERLRDEQRRCLDRFWDRADVTLDDTVRHPVRMQQAVRWNLFHLAQATWTTEGGGVPAKGLTGDAYDGHYFWDTETWVLPFLAYTQPRIARNLLRFRHSMLDKARARARDLDFRGVLFPWRTISGDEASAYHLAGTAQFHLNADQPAFDATVFTKNRKRLLEHEVADEFFAAVVAQAKLRRYVSSEHFTVDGTLFKGVGFAQVVQAQGWAAVGAASRAQRRGWVPRRQAVERDPRVDDRPGRTPVSQEQQHGGHLVLRRAPVDGEPQRVDRRRRAELRRRLRRAGHRRRDARPAAQVGGTPDRGW